MFEPPEANGLPGQADNLTLQNQQHLEEKLDASYQSALAGQAFADPETGVIKPIDLSDSTQLNETQRHELALHLAGQVMGSVVTLLNFPEMASLSPVSRRDLPQYVNLLNNRLTNLTGYRVELNGDVANPQVKIEYSLQELQKAA